MEKLIGEFSVGLFFWQTLLFVAMLFILKKYAWKPILDAVNEREEGIKKALESAVQAKKEMASMNADNEKLLQEARSERDAMLKEAREIKAKLIGDAKDEAKSEADKIIIQAQAAIQSEKKAAIAEIKDQVASLSIDIAEKVIKQALSRDDQQQKLVKDLLDDTALN
ncbi:MAG: ATP F0F1 synthase subunit B [Cryomorphaceae bacterium BACL21 MAG-121220-bin10]|jgi:F-type H+-transporting ATPase subunit b|nr:MAG: ATP F0F1 synthase subunit B [Cryomorphaceae bacterium BACL21 MAG-121220-bin10]MDA0701376.1 F0F1 ATP synthase subunit B [Bacteroidota bacterium]|tara:strand:+ start:1071 stop:1571 length:501 start_codon:yes stop_codon:yes gene_type:complete